MADVAVAGVKRSVQRNIRTMLPTTGFVSVVGRSWQVKGLVVVQRYLLTLGELRKYAAPCFAFPLIFAVYAPINAVFPASSAL